MHDFKSPLFHALSYLDLSQSQSITSSTIDLLQQIYPVPFTKQQVKLAMRVFLIDSEIDPTISDAVQFWLQVLAMKSPMGEQKHLHMSTLSLQLLSIPASNGESERVFSAVRRIKTEFRSSLSTESVAAQISCHFNNTSKCCENKHFDERLIAKAKTCTRERNLRYTSS